MRTYESTARELADALPESGATLDEAHAILAPTVRNRFYRSEAIRYGSANGLIRWSDDNRILPVEA